MSCKCEAWSDFYEKDLTKCTSGQNLSERICFCSRVNWGHRRQRCCTTWTATRKSLMKCQLQLAANEKMSLPGDTSHTGVGFVLWFSLQQLPVVTSSTIVRCRSCRTYINPFVSFLDQRRWKCNLCYRVNDGKKGGWSDERDMIIWKSYCPK